MNIEELARNYQADQATIDTVRQARLVFIAGIVAAGKDTIIEKLLQGPDYHRIISHTTRPSRTNDGVAEKDSIDYHFVSKDTMASLLAEHKMIEVNNFGENYYGTSLAEIARANLDGKIAITDIDVHGVDSFSKMAPGNVTAIFIIPPSYEIWLDRLKRRYQSKAVDLATVWGERQQITINELEYVLQSSNYHYVINDDLDEAVARVNKIAHGYSDGNYDAAKAVARKLLDDIKRSL